MTRIPEEFFPFFDERNFAHIVTLNPDGSPQVSPLWVERDGDEAVLVNTLEGRIKHRNLVRDPRTALSIHRESNPYSFVQVQGRAELAVDEGEAHIHRLSEKYRGEPYANLSPGDVRIVVRIVPDRVVGRV